MRLAARCSQKLLVSISYVPFRAAGYAKSDHPSLPGCLLFARNRHGEMSDLSPLSGVKRKSNFGAVRSVDDRKRSSATPSRLHFGRPEPWEGRLAALLVSRDVLTKAQMSACGG